MVTDQMWDMIAKDQIRKIPRFLAWATKSVGEKKRRRSR